MVNDSNVPPACLHEAEFKWASKQLPLATWGRAASFGGAWISSRGQVCISKCWSAPMEKQNNSWQVLVGAGERQGTTFWCCPRWCVTEITANLKAFGLLLKPKGEWTSTLITWICVLFRALVPGETALWFKQAFGHFWWLQSMVLPDGRTAGAESELGWWDKLLSCLAVRIQAQKHCLALSQDRN